MQSDESPCPSTRNSPLCCARDVSRPVAGRRAIVEHAQHHHIDRAKALDVDPGHALLVSERRDLADRLSLHTSP